MRRVVDAEVECVVVDDTLLVSKPLCLAFEGVLGAEMPRCSLAFRIDGPRRFKGVAEIAADDGWVHEVVRGNPVRDVVILIVPVVAPTFVRSTFRTIRWKVWGVKMFQSSVPPSYSSMRP